MKSQVLLWVVGLGSVLAFPGMCLADSAETYQNELGFSYGHLSDSDDTFETTTLRFDAVHYLQPVNVANHPLAEAAFLEHAASISFLFNRASTDVNDGFFVFSVDQTSYVAELDYASTTSPLTFSVAYGGMKVTSAGTDDLSGNQYLFKIGSYIGSSARIQAIFSQADIEDMTGTSIGLDAKLVHEFGNETALGIDGIIFSSESDSNDGASKGRGYTLGVDYYTSQLTSIGFARDWEAYKDQDGSFHSWTHHFRIKHFLSPQASIAFEYVDTDQDSATNGFNVKFSLRI